MINKNYFIFAAAIALASCSVDEYMGENPEFTQTTKENIIGFGGGTGSMSRVTQNTGPTNKMLDNQFKVYGWKTVETVSDGTSTTTTQTVFDNYWVWYSETATPSNPETTASSDKSWEYVGKKDFKFKTYDNNEYTKGLEKEQYIKYWDYSATDYRFVAGSPISAFTFNKATGEGSDQVAIATATVSGLGGHITPNTSKTSTLIDPAPVYIGKPVKISKSSTNEDNNVYGKPVKFEFVRQQSKVRVGIYETIPGYNITSISFYKAELTSESSTVNLKKETTNSNVILTSTGKNFYGGTGVSATVTYKWDDTPNPSFTYSYSTGVNDAYNWYGGNFEGGINAKSSNEPTVANLYGTDGDMESTTGYFTVIPNNNDNAIIIKCDYTLTSDDGSNETINVKGATAAIPAAYCKWEPNKMYTYIFKISQETNGTTGGTGDKPGLFPITFDATVIAEAANQQGTETIINAPSITTHQAGSVTDNGIQYQYVTNKQIDITVTDDKGDLQDLNTTNTSISKGYIAVYKLTGEKTEAQLTVTAPTETAVSSLNVETNKASFIPDADAYYAIQYCYSVTDSKSVYKYKVIKVGNPTSSGS